MSDELDRLRDTIACLEEKHNKEIKKIDRVHMIMVFILVFAGVEAVCVPFLRCLLCQY